MIQALEKTVIHYSHMRDYGLNKWDADNKSEPNPEKMLKDIGECWYGESCPLCQKYFDEENNGNECAGCPLCENGHKHDWVIVYNSSNWLEFSSACNNMISVLNKLIEKENDK